MEIFFQNLIVAVVTFHILVVKMPDRNNLGGGGGKGCRRDDSAVKNMCCSFRIPGSVPSTYTMAHNHQ